ncbi:MAG: hypothetical protein E7293_02410 [Lachnospiraceae bacterium]|nr:hypothetical protein [Lachnospiraceae bacterium]
MRNFLYRAHRGGAYYTPENTMIAFKESLKQGFAYIETDPCYTKDGVIVLHHDMTINRTCRNKDGSEIEQPLRLKDLTYAQLMEYDAGIYKGEEFKGAKIPRLEELLALAEGKDVVIALDKKISTDNMEPLFDLVEKYHTKVCFSCEDTRRIREILARFPEAMIDYDGNTGEEELKEITDLVKPENLLVWLYMDKPNFAWLTDRHKASKKNCERVKRYARLGLANINNPYDMMEALVFEPDVVEV